MIFCLEKCALRHYRACFTQKYSRGMTTSLISSNTHQPRITLRWWGLLLRAVVALLILLVGNFLRVPLMALPVMRSESTLGLVGNILAPVITLAVCWILVLLWMKHVERKPFASTGFSNFRQMLPGLLGGTAIVAVPTVISALILSALAENGTSVQEISGMSTSMIVLSVVFIISKSFILQGIPEELIYRGWLFSLTKARPWFTVAWTTAAFTIIHLLSQGGQQNMWQRVEYLVLPLSMGLLAGAVVLLTDNPWYAAGTHGGMHLCNGLLPLVFAYNQQGPQAWYIGALCQGVVAAALLVLWRRRQA